MATKRTTTTKRIPANIKFASSNSQGQRFLIASEYSDDVEHGIIQQGDLAAVSIVYANTAQAAIGRFRKQFPSKENKNLDVVAIEYPSKIALTILKASLSEEEETIGDIELMYCVENEKYKTKKLRQAKARRERVAAKKVVGSDIVPNKTELKKEYAVLADEYFEAASLLANRAGVKISKKSITTRSKKEAIKTAKASLKAKTRVKPVKKKTVKKKAKKKVTTKKKVSKK